MRASTFASRLARLFIATCTLTAGCSCSDDGWDPGPPDSFRFEVIRQGFGYKGAHGERRVTFLATADFGEASGKWLVYTNNGVAYLVDLENGQEGVLAGPLFGGLFLAYPSIWNNRVVFTAFRRSIDGGESDADILVCDLDSWRGVHLGGPDRSKYPSIWESKVAWVDFRFFRESSDSSVDLNKRRNVEIYYQDLSGGAEVRVTDAPYEQWRPRIHGDHIVWYDLRDPAQMDVFLYDISTGNEKNLTDHSADQWSPEVGERGVVWVDLRNGEGYGGLGPFWNTDIYFYEFATGETRQITTDPNDQLNPRIFGRYIVWNDLRDGGRASNGYPSGANVYLYDLDTGQEKRVTWSEHNEGGGVVAGDKILWWSALDGAIYMKALGEL